MLGNKYIPTIIFTLTFVTFSLGQTYGNEWINYSQKYFSFKVYPNSMPNSFGPTTTQDHRVYMIDYNTCLLYTSPSPRDVEESRMPSSA